jgi:hypothetical protein
MARIQRLKKTALQTEKIHGEVECTYSTFSTSSGRRYFQIDTYGSPARKLVGKKSQTIQLDQQAAEDLIALLSSTLPIHAA